jgi:hypothetical protein
LTSQTLIAEMVSSFAHVEPLETTSTLKLTVVLDKVLQVVERVTARVFIKQCRFISLELVESFFKLPILVTNIQIMEDRFSTRHKEKEESSYLG